MFALVTMVIFMLIVLTMPKMCIQMHGFPAHLNLTKSFRTNLKLAITKFTMTH